MNNKNLNAEQFLKGVSAMDKTCAGCKFFEHGKDIGYCREYKVKTESGAPKCSKWRYFA